MAAKVLQLRSSDGKSLARWDADFQRRLEENGLAKEAATAAQELRRYGIDHGGRPHRHAATAASDVAAPAKAARVDPVRVWCVNHGERSHAPAMPGSFDASDTASAARPGPATTLPAAAGADPVDVRCAIRARGRQMAEDEESACHHRKCPASKAPLCLPATAVAPVKKAAYRDSSVDTARSTTLSSPLHTFRPNSNSIHVSCALALAVLLLAATVAAAPLAGAIPIPGKPLAAPDP
uniref:Uncharacterized protein n=1 Tax=Aegilops tauschii TaxID=37682 RepID=M8CCS7_AEGTA